MNDGNEIERLDYFAALAMAALIKDDRKSFRDPNAIAKRAYDYAEALDKEAYRRLAVRAKVFGYNNMSFLEFEEDVYP